MNGWDIPQLASKFLCAELTPVMTYPIDSVGLRNWYCHTRIETCSHVYNYVVYVPPDLVAWSIISHHRLPHSLPCNPASVSSPLVCFNLCELQNLTKCFCEPLGNDECKLCCQAKVANSTCAPLGDDVLLLDGSTCLGGVCRLGRCEITTQDLASRLFDLFSSISIDAFSEYVYM